MDVYYGVRPRFTPGSPCGLLDVATWAQALRDERDGCGRALEGVYGEEQQRLAKERGLRGVVEVTAEAAYGYAVYDAGTGAFYWRPAHGSKVTYTHPAVQTVQVGVVERVDTGTGEVYVRDDYVGYTHRIDVRKVRPKRAEKAVEKRLDALRRYVERNHADLPLCTAP